MGLIRDLSPPPRTKVQGEKTYFFLIAVILGYKQNMYEIDHHVLLKTLPKQKKLLIGALSDED